MPHIHTKPGQHDATASAFIVRFDTPKPTLMLHQHKKLHKLLQPGGHVELHETPWQAVLHEIEEETGYALSQLVLLQPKERLTSLTSAVLHPIPVCENTHRFNQELDHYHTDRAYVFAADGAPLYKPHDGESAELYWLTAAQLAQLTSDDIAVSSKEIGLYVLSICATTWERVPLANFVS